MFLRLVMGGQDRGIHLGACLGCDTTKCLQSDAGSVASNPDTPQSPHLYASLEVINSVSILLRMFTLMDE